MAYCDGGHHVHWLLVRKNKSASLDGTGPVSGFCLEIGLMLDLWLAVVSSFWDKLVAKMNLNVVGFFSFPMPSQPWAGSNGAHPLRKPSDLRGFKYRTIGLAADMLQEMGMVCCCSCQAAKLCLMPCSAVLSTPSNSTTPPPTCALALKTWPSSTPWAPSTRLKSSLKLSSTKTSTTLCPPI